MHRCRRYRTTLRREASIDRRVSCLFIDSAASPIRHVLSRTSRHAISRGTASTLRKRAYCPLKVPSPGTSAATPPLGPAAAHQRVVAWPLRASAFGYRRHLNLANPTGVATWPLCRGYYARTCQHHARQRAGRAVRQRAWVTGGHECAPKRLP